MNLNVIRKKFPIVNSKVFLNHAETSPLPRPSIEAIMKCIERLSFHGEHSINLKEGRALFARLLNAKEDEIAIIPSTSTGLNIVANMLEYPRGSNIVTTDLEYPAVVYPWLRRKLKVEVRYAQSVNGFIELNEFEKMIDDDTVAVTISHVEYTNGFRNNLRAIAETAHEHGAFLIVDAIQSVGALNVNVKECNVDFLATSSYKWLLAPSGMGFMYIRRDLTEKFEPTFVGCAGVKEEIFKSVNLWNNRELLLVDEARRFEVSEPSVLSYVGTVASVRMILNFGLEWIEKRVLKLTGNLIEELKELNVDLQTPEEEDFRAGIVNFKVKDPDKIVNKLRDDNVIVSARGNGLRISPHFYNSYGEIEKLIDSLKKLLRY